MDIRKVEAIYDRAAVLSGPEQKEYLDRICPEGTEMRTLVTEMLHQTDEASVYFERLQQNILHATDYQDAIIDNYRLKKLIGEGGMSRVYAATRTDGLYHQEVAVKIIKTGFRLEGRQVEKERQILANLNHPNIAKIYNAGFTENNEPYIVMEYIDGMPIDQYCRQTATGFKDRMALFFQVCKAVQYAHQRLVIHCDLKPSNILVSKRGEVKLLDFGIASLLNQQDSEMATMLTPNHAAPEQFTKNGLHTSTDVYQLGLLLHLMLTGAPALQLNQLSLSEKKDKIFHEPPELHIDKINISGYLKDDIASILLHALEKDPLYRYHTVDLFHQDLKNALHSLPVLHLPHHPPRRVRKYIIRNQKKAIIVFSVLFILLAMSAFYAYHLQHQRSVAEDQAERAETMKAFLLDIMNIADPYSQFGPEVSVRQMLAEASQRVDETFKDRKSIRAELYYEMGKIYSNYKLFEEAKEMLNKALQLYKQLYGEDSRESIEVYTALGFANTEVRDTVAYDFMNKALALAKQHYGPRSLEYASIIKDFSSFRFFASTPRKDSLCIIALEIAENAPGDNRQLIAEILHNCTSGGRLPGDGIKHKQRAIALMKEVKGEDHPLVGEFINDLSLIMGRHDMEYAYRLNEESYRILAKNLGEFHPNTLTVLNNLAVTKRQLNDYDSALILHRKAMNGWVEHHPEQEKGVAYAKFGYGVSFKELGNYEECVSPIEESREILLKHRGKDDHLVFITEKNLVEAYTALEKYDVAAPYVQNIRKYAINETRFGAEEKENAQQIVSAYFIAQNLPVPADIHISHD